MDHGPTTIDVRMTVNEEDITVGVRKETDGFYHCYYDHHETKALDRDEAIEMMREELKPKEILVPELSSASDSEEIVDETLDNPLAISKSWDQYLGDASIFITFESWGYRDGITVLSSKVIRVYNDVDYVNPIKGHIQHRVMSMKAVVPFLLTVNGKSEWKGVPCEFEFDPQDSSQRVYAFTGSAHRFLKQWAEDQTKDPRFTAFLSKMAEQQEMKRKAEDLQRQGFRFAAGVPDPGNDVMKKARRQKPKRH